MEKYLVKVKLTKINESNDKYFQERMEVVIEVVEKNLTKYGVTITHPTGGYFLWVKLPPEVNSARVWDISKTTENVTFVKGNV